MFYDKKGVAGMSKAEQFVWEGLSSPPERMTNSIRPFGNV
jgi:hypothetical protein